MFKGIDKDKLSFEGKGEYAAPTKPNGLDGVTQKTAYLVTYNNGVITLKAGEVVRPKVIDAKVENDNKDKIVLTLDKAPADAFTAADKTDFIVTITNGNIKDHTVKTVESNNTTVTITLNKELAADNTDIKLNYGGTKIGTLTDKAVTNNIQAQAVQVTLGEVKVDGTTLSINVSDKTLKTVQDLGKEGFTVTKGDNSTPVTINSAAVANKTITLTLDDAIQDNDTSIKVKYDGNNTKLVEDSTNNPIAAIKETFVVNEKDTTAPQLSTATAIGSGKAFTITLPVNEPIKATNITSSNTVVTITGTNSNSAVVQSTTAKVGDDNKSLVLTVNTDKDLTPGSHKFKVSYKASDEVKDYGKSGGNNLAAKDIDNIVISPSRTTAIVSSSDSDLVATSLLKVAEVEAINGKVTVINKFKGADQSVIQSMLTSDLTKIANGAFSGISNMVLDFSKISNVDSVIDNNAFDGASKLKIEYKGNSEEAYKLAKKLKNISGVTVNNKEPNNVIKDYENNNNNNGGSGSGGGSSSGGSGGGSGANIGTITNKKPNTEETTSQGNKNETVVENKQLSFDVIKLPSVEGEAKVFGDVSANHWAKSYIDKLSTARIINGSNGMFNPNGQTKRADVTVMLVNLLGLTPEANNKFADVNASAYYAPYVGTASNYGIVNGSNGMFNPQGVISRQDTMVMIAQILKGLDLNVNADTTALKQFGDANKVSAYANESVAILVNSGIISGNNGKLNPTAPVTRAEMATIMSKLYDVLASANK